MRVDKKMAARIIKNEMRYIKTQTDKERAIDYTLYSFARLHGIGVYPVERAIHGNSIQYRFVSQNIQRYHDNNWYERPEDDAINIIINFNEVDDLEHAMREVMKAAEHHYNLPHWEDYLEKKPEDDNGAPKKHDDRPDAMYYLASRGCGKTNWATQQAIAYCKNDVKATRNLYDTLKAPELKVTFAIDKVVFNEPATIVMWKDGTKTVVKAQDGEVYDPEKGLAMAICKKVMGNTRDYYNVFLKHLKQWKKENPENPNELISTYGALSKIADIFDIDLRVVDTFDMNGIVYTQYKFSNSKDSHFVSYPEIITFEEFNGLQKRLQYLRK